MGADSSDGEVRSEETPGTRMGSMAQGEKGWQCGGRKEERQRERRRVSAKMVVRLDRLEAESAHGS